MHQESFPLLQTATLKHIGPDGEVVFRQSRRLQQTEPLGNRQSLPLGDADVLGISATIGQTAYRVAHLPAGHALAQRHHMARGFQTQNGRGTWWRRIAATALQAIGAVHTRISNFHQNLASGWRGHIALGGLQYVGGTATAVVDKAHQSGDRHRQNLVKNSRAHWGAGWGVQDSTVSKPAAVSPDSNSAKLCFYTVVILT